MRMCACMPVCVCVHRHGAPTSIGYRLGESRDPHAAEENNFLRVGDLDSSLGCVPFALFLGK